MIPYVPYNSGTRDTPSKNIVFLKGDIWFNEKAAFLREITQWLSEQIKQLKNSYCCVAVTIAPGHDQYSTGHGFLTHIVQAAISRARDVTDGSRWLIRHTGTESSLTGTRDIDRHLQTIRINDQVPVTAFNQLLLGAKCVIVFDDIWTTGSTLEACKQIIENSGIDDVHVVMVAIGKTV